MISREQCLAIALILVGFTALFFSYALPESSMPIARGTPVEFAPHPQPFGPTVLHPPVVGATPFVMVGKPVEWRYYDCPPSMYFSQWCDPDYLADQNHENLEH